MFKTENTPRIYFDFIKNIKASTETEVQNDSKNNNPHQSKRIGKYFIVYYPFLLKRKDRNILRGTNNAYQSPFGRIYRIHNILGINEKSIIDETHSEAYFYTLFYSRRIIRAEMYKNAVVFDLSQTQNLSFSPTFQQVVDRYRSLGNERFSNIADVLQEFSRSLNNSKQYKQARKTKIESVTRFLQSMQDQRFICLLTLNKLAISKSLLQFLGYDINQFTIEAVKYRSISQEFFSSKNYYKCVMHIIKCFINIVKFTNNRITLLQLQERTVLEYQDRIYDKNGLVSLCQFQINVPQPSYICQRLIRVINCSKEIRRQSVYVDLVKQNKQTILSQQFSIIKTLKILTQFQQSISIKTAQYKSIQQQIENKQYQNWPI